ncbi:purine-nucleoside phosphorylase [Streptomyces montanus]|uniref:Uridine phosphorylase n=1 Tax=Streptomyces montanus TaxID=2580423 RepID=A0A5R9FZM8_9ACTN|nr:nucleoside phosphorylase [Streptomyces montanus]TLS46193.1 purine-nucleoside phosphorylase [Streptomyces montanus]
MTGPAPHGVPRFSGKHTVASLTDPAEHAAHIRRRHPDADLTHTAGAVLVFQSSLARETVRRDGVWPLGPWVAADLHRTTDGAVICSGFGRGAPAAALIVEQLIALGARAIITIGTAATLTDTLAAGDLVVCREALRGEGLSHHYLRPGRYIAPDSALTQTLTRHLTLLGEKPHTGRAWTTDALYRETEAEVYQYVSEGVLTADMEAAGVLAVAAYRGIPAAAAFTVADSLARRTMRTDSPRTGTGLRVLYEAATRTLAERPSA